MNLWAFAIKATLQLAKVHKNSVSHAVLGRVIGISQSVLMHRSQYFHHIQFILYIVRRPPHFSTETHGHAIFPHKVRKEETWKPRSELIWFSDVIFKD